MKIFIGCDEVASILYGLSEGLKACGHEVTTLVKSPHQFYNYTYSYNTNLLSKYVDRRKIKNTLADKTYGAVNTLIRSVYSNLLLPRLVREHDLFIFMWSSLRADFSDLTLIKKHNRKIISVFVGSDVRDPIAFQQEFGADVTKWGSEYFENFNQKLSWLRMNELYSDAVFSVPDQAGLALRPYHHLYLPFAYKAYNFNIPDNQVIRVLHAPSKKGIKGTDIILAALEALTKEGLPIDVKLLSGVPHHILKKELEQADVLVDELILHGPGMLSMEAMASGCAVATKFLDAHTKIFNPPVCSINESNIYDQLKRLFTDREYRLDLARKGRSFIEKNNDHAIIAGRMINTLSAETTGPDYFPAFFLNQYTPGNPQNISRKNRKLGSDVLKIYGAPASADLTKAKERGLIDRVPEDLRFFKG